MATKAPAAAASVVPLPSATTTTANVTTTGHQSVGFQMAKLRCRVHPAVIMTMLDAHGRSNEANRFSIGTLLGTVTTEVGPYGTNVVVVEIVDCFVNPYVWDLNTTSLTIQKEQHEWMLKLREKISPKLTVVGWCCTTSKVLYTSALSEWAKDENKVSRFQPTKSLPEPVHILIDPEFSNKLSLLSETKAYVRGVFRQLFHEIPLEIALNPAETAGVAAILKASSFQHPVDGGSGFQQANGSQRVFQAPPNTLAASLKKLKDLLEVASEYTRKVVAGEIEGDVELGRSLMRAVCAESLLPKAELEAICEASVQDNLMIAYLTNLAMLQLAVAEKLNTSFWN